MHRLSVQLETVKGFLRRDLTQPELDAMVEHTSRDTNMRRIGLPIGVTAGSIHAYYTLRKRLAMPNNVSLFESFKVAWRTAPVLERRQAVLQAGLRFGLWTIFMLGNFGALAAYRFTVVLSSDERLGDFRQAIKRYAEARMQRAEGHRETARQRREERDAIRHGRSGGAAASAEMPIEEEYKEAATDTSATYGQDQNQVYSQSDAANSYQPYPTSRQNYPVPRSYQAEESAPTSSDFFDDASPTAPEYQTSSSMGSAGASTPVRSNENAWERIRRQNSSSAASAASASTQSRWGQQNAAPSGGFSTSEREQAAGQRERDAAQRDFDRMLDAERQISQDVGDGERDNKGQWRRR